MPINITRRYCTKLQIIIEVLETFRGCSHDPVATFASAQFTLVVVPERKFCSDVKWYHVNTK